MEAGTREDRRTGQTGAVRAQLNEVDELAVDQAVGIALRQSGVEITAVTMGRRLAQARPSLVVG